MVIVIRNIDVISFIVYRVQEYSYTWVLIIGTGDGFLETWRFELVQFMIMYKENMSLCLKYCDNAVDFWAGTGDRVLVSLLHSSLLSGVLYLLCGWGRWEFRSGSLFPLPSFGERCFNWRAVCLCSMLSVATSGAWCSDGGNGNVASLTHC